MADPMSPRLLFTPRALASLRRLRGEQARRAETLLEKMALGKARDQKKLSGYGDRYRTRSGNLRVLWTRSGEKDAAPLVVFVGLRGDLYEKTASLQPDQASRIEEVLYAEEATEPEELEHFHDSEPDSWPAYIYDATADWTSFLYDKFRLTPRLTDEQRARFRELLNYKGRARRIAVVQGGAGSGKSVCAVEAACRLKLGGKPEMNGEQVEEVIYLAPARLAKHFRSFPAVGKVFETTEDHFMTVEAWFRRLLTQAGIDAPPNREVEALRRAVAREKKSRTPIALEDVTEQDALLYQAFVLGDVNPKDVAWQEHGERIAELQKVRPEIWQRILEEINCTSSTGLAAMVIDALREGKILRSEASKALIIVDEAQDLLLEQLRAIKEVGAYWDCAGEGLTRLWLFGDLNQRIAPSGFYWDDLPEKVGLHIAEIPFNRNYRNTSEIVRFSNRIHALASDVAAEHDARQLPPPADPTVCAEEGEPVAMLRTPDLDAALRFLDTLKEGGEEAYLRREMSASAQVITRGLPDRYERGDIIVHVPKEVKGLELETCVAVNLFTGSESPTLSEINEWYTLVTRSRTRLLLVLTDAEVERLGTDLFEEARPVDAETARSWILEYGSAVDLSESADEACRRLVEMRSSGLPWLDTWEVLVESEMDAAEWEKQVRPTLQSRDLSPLLTQSCSWLRCLTYRLQGRWQRAFGELDRFTEQYRSQTALEVDEEFERLALRIADGLERSGLPFEAELLRQRTTRAGEWPDDYPFPELAGRSQTLAPAVTQLISDRLTP